MLKIRGVGKAVDGSEPRKCIGAKQALQFGQLPAIEFTLFCIGFRIDSRIKTSLLIAHFSQNKIKQFLCNAAIRCISGERIGFGIDRGKLPVVVKHFLKMRNIPESIDTVAVKSATHMIADATLRHFIECEDKHFFSFPIFFAMETIG